VNGSGACVLERRCDSCGGVTRIIPVFSAKPSVNYLAQHFKEKGRGKEGGARGASFSLAVCVNYNSFLDCTTQMERAMSRKQ
jgi:hypothetical protein